MNSRIEWKQIETPYGPMALAIRRRALIGAWFEGQKHFNGIQEDWQETPDSVVLCEAERQLHEWFAGKRQDFVLELAPEGSEFQRRVWAAIARLRFGETTDYGTLARQLGRPKAARAVGAATGRNPLTIIIPCHRLLSRDGKLTGYAGGLERKQALLAFEAKERA
ncbi:MAG: methylated-DNA--[protein]-cysteine S-methyltransferase [Burkholderiales bacterium]|jgi:methylated-DNA-[protein]-cysteine S-methyltransferase|nr:methylated-DNA--[protein]-cysteine S-methyltransferase [Burkholderiales bacterium]